MPAATCTWIEENLGELGQRPLPAHLDGCARCRARFEELERGLRAALLPPPVPLSPELDARIRAAVAARFGKPRRSILRPVALGLAGAAALPMVVALLYVLFQKPPPNAGAPHVDLDPPKSGCAVPW